MPGETLLVDAGFTEDDKTDGRFTQIQRAVDNATPGTTILVEPGIYTDSSEFTYEDETFTAAAYITTCHLTIRGNGTSPDDVTLLGGADADTACDTGTDYGLYADDSGNVTFENLNASEYKEYGFYWSHVDGFYGYDLKAGDNCVYGILTFASHNGEVAKSEAWGSGDSGLYIGEIADCDCDIHHNDVHGNVVGYSGTRANHVLLRDNSFHDNIVGILPNTLTPDPMHALEHVVEGAEDRQSPVQCCSMYVDNLIEHNNAEYLTEDNPDGDVRAHGFAEDIAPPSGVGIMLAGASGNLVYNNTILDHDLWGIALNWLFVPPNENMVIRNTIANSGEVDIWWDEWGVGNCFQDNRRPGGSAVSSDPQDLPDCGSPSVRTPDAVKEAHLACLAVIEPNTGVACSQYTGALPSDPT